MQEQGMDAHLTPGKISVNFQKTKWLFCRATAHSTAIYEIIVTGGISGGQATSSTESFDLSTRTWTPFTDLPFNMANHAQLDLGSPRLYGGDISGSEHNLILQYTNTNWNLANVSIPSDLKFHHVTKYPANLVGF